MRWQNQAQFIHWGILASGTLLASFQSIGQAQIIPDATLPTNSQVNVGCQICAIEGGTVRGSNLFHSFREFSIPTGGEAWFNNTPQIQNILTRVTGTNISNIDGLIRANGTANLFLLNPNGIIFGPNARLQIGGSFVASTANSFRFPDGSEFSATNPQAPPLLTVNIIPGLQYGRPIGNIAQAGNLAVSVGQTLSLHGNVVTHSGSLAASGGRVEVLGDRIALLDTAQIDVSAPTGGGTILIGGDLQGRGTVPNASRTFVAPGVTLNADAIAAGNGGKVIIWSDEATRFYGTVSAKGGTRSGNGGFVEVSGQQYLDYQGTVNTLAPNGLPGTLLLDPTNITVVAGGNNPPELAANDQFADPGVNNTIADGTINAATANVILQATNDITFSTLVNINMLPGVGLTVEASNNILFQGSIPLSPAIATNGGDVNLRAGNNILFQGVVTPFLGSIPAVITNGGNANLSAGADVVLNSFAIRTNSSTGGNSGNMTIATGATGRLLLQNRGILTTDTFGAGTAGNITIQASEVNVSTPAGLGSSGITANSLGGSGNAGRISVTTGRLAVTRSQIQAFTDGAGNAGEIIVQANQVELDGQGDLTRVSGLLAIPNSTASTGRSGIITVNTQSLVVRDGGGIYAGTVSASPGGSLTVRASDIDLTGTGLLPSTLSVGALVPFGATGDGGTMQITTDRLTVRNGAIVNASALLGQAGNLGIQANTINVLDGGIIESEGRNGGNVSLDTAELQVKNSSFISVGSLFGNVGGSLRIRARENVTVQNNSSITTSSVIGRGGDLQIETPNLAIQNLSVVASSALGVGSAGNVTVRAADTVLVDGISALGSNAIGAAVTTGNLLVETGNLTIQNGGQVSTVVIGQGRGGNISVNAGNLLIQNAGYVTTSVVGQGQGGNLAIAVEDSIRLSDRSVVSTGMFGAGAGGTLSVSARNLDVLNQSSINTVSFDRIDSPARTGIFADLQPDVIQSSLFQSTIFGLVNTIASSAAATGGQGNAGELSVQVRDSITLANRSSLATVGAGNTNGARLSVQTANLNLLDGGALRSGIVGRGRGGDIDVQATNLRSQRGLISSQGLEFGTAANITLSLRDTLNSNGGEILASSTQSGGGNIDITARDVRLRNGSLISTSVFDSTGGGGNINIRSSIFIALEDSDILANAEFGPGGNIFINSPTFLADFFRTGRATAVGRNPGSFSRFRGNGRVDISADSQAGTSGTVIFPNLDLNRGLTPLNVDLVDPSQQIAQTCVPRGADRTGSFTVTGRGGLPPDPDTVLQNESVISDWVTVSEAQQSRDRALNSNQAVVLNLPSMPAPIVEANHWIQAANGEISLVVNIPVDGSTPSVLQPVNCETSSLSRRL